MARAYKKRKRIIKPHFANKRSVKQRVWDYMRRNRKFKLNDIVTILDLNVNTVKSILHCLQAAAMVRRQKDKKLSECTFTFVEDDRIIKAPIITPKEVYCTTRNLSIKIEAKTLLKKIYKQKSQAKIAKELNLSKATVNLILNDKYPNVAKIYDKILEVYG